ncbi:hypothetical protein BH10PSE7_BH10PSE7_01650 [soil metagenome]
MSDSRAGKVFWIFRGQIMFPPESGQGNEAQENELIERHGFVKVSQSATGTEIKWSVFAPNWASLYFVLEWIDTFPAPYTLNYNLAGWFEERQGSHVAARDRILAILGKSDIHLTRRTFVQDADPGRADIPDLLKDVLQRGSVLPDYSIECILDNSSGKFNVERVGRKTEIARLWGMSPVSFPCLTGHSYDRIVSEAYRHVLKTGEPHFDHVCAAMVAPDAVTTWQSYQRVILPHTFSGSKRGVIVVSKGAPVDIKVI